MDSSAYQNSNSNIYQPLGSTDQIRLLVLQRGKWNQPLRGTIRLASLDQAPHYEALSYVWGDATIQRPFEISGTVMSITTNLETALRYLRREHGHRVLWVDAICINQADLSERTQQVLQMAQIFKSARKVLAWTGEAEPDTEEAIDILLKLGLLGTHVCRTERITPSILEENAFDITSIAWTKLHHLLQREYWSRVWIIQELAVNYDVVVFLVGKHSFAGKHFDFAALAYFKIFYHSVRSDFQDYSDRILNALPPRLYPALSIYMIIGGFRDLEYSLEKLLLLTSRSKASDPRDQIYALLNLASQLDREAIQPDYQKSYSQLKIDVVFHFIQTGRNLDCLQGIRLDPSAPDHERPSWAQIHFSMAYNSHKWLNLDHHPAGDLPVNAKLMKPPGSLAICGLVVDLVEHVKGPFSYTYELCELVLLICDAFSIISPHQRDHIWRCLVMDSEMVENQPERTTAPAPPHLHAAFDYLTSLSQNRPPSGSISDFILAVPPSMQASVESFMWNCALSIEGRSVFATQKYGYFGIGPQGTKSGDLVVALYGSKSCHVLRPEDDHWLLVGDAYVQGVMQGQLLEDPARCIEQTFVLQ